MTWSVTNIPLEAVDEMWPTVAPLLAPAVERSHGRVDMAAVTEGLTARRYLLWVAYAEDREIAAAFITRVAVYPRKSMLAIDFAGGGRMSAWLPTVLDTFRRFAEDSGLDGAEFYGREGWVKPVSRYGWRQNIVLCEIDARGREEQNRG